MENKSRWNPGQNVMARDPASGRWRRATIRKPEPYRTRDGADIAWADIDWLTAGSSVSSGGWNFEIVDGWDEGAAALAALGEALSNAGHYAALFAARRQQT